MKLFPATLACLALAACQTADELERSADREVAAILAEKSAVSVDLRPQTVVHPTTTVPAPTPPAIESVLEPTAPAAQPEEPPQSPPAEATIPAPPPVAVVPAEPPQDPSKPTSEPQAPAVAVEGDRAPRTLTLREALEIAVTSGRDYIGRKESLYLTALGLTGTRYDFGPRLTAALSYTFADSDSSPTTHAAGASAGISQRLPWGGNVGVTAREDFSDAGTGGNPRAFSSGLAIALTQPLLRGFGSEVANEALTQAERNTLYAIREFELFREDYSIRVASSYYDLVQQKQTVENQRRNKDNLAEERRKAEALFQVGRKPELELLRARRSELTSMNDLIEAEESLRLALDRFRIFLGLPDTDRVDVLPEEPVFVPVHFDVHSAIQAALKNRLDYLNRREQLEDAARSLRITKNGLLPDLTLSAGYNVNADANPSFTRQQLDRESYSASLSLDLPIDRTLDRNAWKSARIQYGQALRSFELFEDEMVVSVQSTFRELERRKQSVEIQKELIVDQEKNVRIAQILFEQGDNSNRDVVEAQQSLLDAKNNLIREQVSYEIARLGLLRDLGILFIDEHGVWTE